VTIPHETSEGLWQSSRFVRSKIVITRLHLCKTPRFTGKKKVYFSLAASSRALQVHPVACFERVTAKVEFYSGCEVSL
jgi:hypothetical protein